MNTIRFEKEFAAKVLKAIETKSDIPVPPQGWDHNSLLMLAGIAHGYIQHSEGVAMLERLPDATRDSSRDYDEDQTSAAYSNSAEKLDTLRDFVAQLATDLHVSETLAYGRGSVVEAELVLDERDDSWRIRVIRGQQP
jgi:hypothetical protein